MEIEMRFAMAETQRLLVGIEPSELSVLDTEFDEATLELKAQLSALFRQLPTKRKAKNVQ